MNNEVNINETYKDRIKNLDLFVSFAYEDETYCIPKESVHFKYYSLEDPEKIEALKESKFYKEDHLGIRYLDEHDKVF